MRHFTLLLLASFVLLIPACSSSLGKPEIWRNPSVFDINKEKAHAEFIHFKNPTEALKPLNLENPWNSACYQSLNGEWDFNWYAELKDVPKDWYQNNTSLDKWEVMPVPGIWQNHGFDQLYYLNVTMPFEYDWEKGVRAKGFREDEIEQSKETGYIPYSAQTVGCYRKWIDINKTQLDERVVLRIGAVEAGVQVFVNGKEVGYSQGSMTPAEFEVSKYLSEGKNLVALKVFRWTDGSYMEVQDMVRFAGIYRDVFLRFEPKQHIRDIKFIGNPEASLKSANGSYTIVVSNETTKTLENAELHFDLVSNDDQESLKTWVESVATVSANEEVSIEGAIKLDEVKLWSPDLPNLYTLIVSLFDANGDAIQVTRSDVGFKRFEDINGNLHLNGKRFYIRGVNRHDHHAKYGKHVPLASMVRDLELMKQNNINTVRTSHYPNDERWYYLCNRYGMALIDEANVECHLMQDVPGNRPQWRAAAVDRVESMVQRDKNHPSIIIWSLGNEQGWGWTTAFDAQFDRAKEIDDSRLVMCDRGNRYKKDYDTTRLDKPDTVTPMYGTLNKMRGYLNNRHIDKRPFFMCEYRHAMGNSVGSLKEVWDVIYDNETNGLNGGCIWDWMDQGVEAKDTDGTIYYQYGGDWGDKISEYNFCLNGLIMADQSWTPKLEEVRKCYEPFSVEAISIEKGTYRVLNRLNQTDMSGYKTTWSLMENGKIVQSGIIQNINTKPYQKQAFRLPYQASKLKANKEYIFRIAFELSDDQVWAAKGHEVSFSEFKLKGDYSYTLAKAQTKPSVKEDKEHISIKTSKGVALTFDKKTGALSSFKMDNYELLAKSERAFLFDYDMAWIDNLYSITKDRNRLSAFVKLGLENIARKGDATVKIDEKGNNVVVSIKNAFVNANDIGYIETQTWSIDDLGQITLDELVTPTGDFNRKTWIPRIGLRFPLKPELNQVSYYGLGPYGNYPDRAYGSWTAIHNSSVADNYVAYPNPQDHGNREQVRWMSIINKQGIGLKVTSPSPLSMSALPYTQEELQKARHTIDLPKQSTTTELRVAAKITGIGNGSCGPVCEPAYKPNAEETKYRVVILPILKR